MSDFINTVDVVGDAALVDSIIDKSITELYDNVTTSIKGWAFYECKNLEHVNMPNLKFGASTTSAWMFGWCSNLKTVELPNLKTVYQSMFRKCTSLQRVKLDAAAQIDNYGFYSCEALEVVDLPVAHSLYSYVFNSCSNLKALILRRTAAICKANGSSFVLNTPIASGAGYIYVPAALVDTYKAATNWSTYANQFRTLEDYTVDGTITGELDETKI